MHLLFNVIKCTINQNISIQLFTIQITTVKYYRDSLCVCVMIKLCCTNKSDFMSDMMLQLIQMFASK